MQRAADAAKRVDVSKNDDVEDLYLVYSALDAAGDKEGDAAVKKRIDALPYVSFVVRSSARGSARGFSATARRARGAGRRASRPGSPDSIDQARGSAAAS